MTAWVLLAALLVGLLGVGSVLRGSQAGGVKVRRAALWIGAVAALAVLVARPSWTEASGEGTLLVTVGTRAEDLRPLRDRVDASWRVFDLTGGTAATVFPTAGDFGDLAAWSLAGGPPAASPVVVTGWGLPEEEWRRLRLRPTEHRPPGQPEGVLEISWPRQLELGRALEVRARVRVREASVLVLRGPGGVEDRQEIEPSEQGALVSLRAVPRAPGGFVYLLAREVAGERVGERRIDVHVTESVAPAVLWLEGAPTFESREVRAWLAGLGGAVGVRSRISRDRFRVDTRNLPEEVDLARLDPGLLRRFDLLVVDGESWSGLAPFERQAIDAAIREDGLGVLLLVDPGVAGPLPWGLSFAGTDREEAGLVRPRWPDADGDGPALEDAGVRFVADGAWRPLLEDRTGEPLALWRPEAGGRVGASLVRETFRWVLEGRVGAHRGLWSHVVETLARPVAGDRWILPAGPVLRDRTVRLGLETAVAVPDIGLLRPDGREVTLAPRQASSVPRRWEVSVVPRDHGWYRLRSDAGESWFFADDPGPWGDLERERRLEATQARTRADGVETRGALVPSARFFLWSIAVGCLVGLWVDERLVGG